MIKHIGFLSLTLIFFVSLTAFALRIPKAHLVSVKWLSENLNNPNLVIVDVRAPNAYKAGHIPHAVNIPRSLNFQKGFIGNIKYLLDTPYKITKIFRDAGISNNSIVVFYSSSSKKGYTFATREFFEAWMYGLHNIAILKGGIEAWISNNKPISKKIFMPKKGNFKIVDMSLSSIATWPDIYYYLATKKVQLIDSREPKHFKGLDKDPRLQRHGHIPGAVEIPYYDFVKKVGNYYELVSPEKVKEILKNKGISILRPIIVYCNTGHLASGDWFVIKFLAGAKNIKLYDGSLHEYAKTNLPIAK